MAAHRSYLNSSPIDGVVNYIRPLLTEDTYIKLPTWKEMDKLENALKQQTMAHVINSHANSIQLIQQAEVVLCYGASSIHAETSMLGKGVICLLDTEGILPREQKKKLKHLENVYFHDYTKKTPVPESLLYEVKQCQQQPMIKPFDYQLVKNIIKEIE